MRVKNALLVDYEYCLGCAGCEVACMNEHGYTPQQLGIKVTKLGPWETRDGSWQYDFVPVITDWCDMCDKRVSAGGRPACVRHCEYGVITYGNVDELVESFRAKEKMILVSPRHIGK